MMSTWPPDSISRGGTHEVAAINDAFGGRRNDALRHIQWIRDHGPHASPMRNVLDGLEVTVEALAGDPEHVLAIAPDARQRLYRTMESVWRAELLLAIDLARFRLGDIDRSLLYLEHLRTSAMNHPVICEIRRSVARDARAAIGDRDRVAEIRLAAAEIDLDHALDQELGVPLTARSRADLDRARCVPASNRYERISLHASLRVSGRLTRSGRNGDVERTFASRRADCVVVLQVGQESLTLKDSARPC